MNTEETFSFQSGDRKRNFAYKNLQIELAVLVIAIAIIIGILAYFKIEPFAQLRNIVPDINNQIQIETKSDIPGYSLQIVDKSGLTELFSSWGVFNRSYPPSIYKEGDLGGKQLRKITIRLTSQVQSANRYSSDRGQTFYSSSFAKLKDGEMEILIHLDRNFYNKVDRDVLEESAMIQVVRLLYKMTRDVTSPAQIQARDEQITKILQDLHSSKKEFILVKMN